MNHENSPRRLRLEKLESRELLAGGIFDFTENVDQHRSSRDSNQRKPDRPSLESIQEDRTHRDHGKPQRRDRDGGRPVENAQETLPATVQPPLQTNSVVATTNRELTLNPFLPVSRQQTVAPPAATTLRVEEVDEALTLSIPSGLVTEEAFDGDSAKALTSEIEIGVSTVREVESEPVQQLQDLPIAESEDGLLSTTDLPQTFNAFDSSGNDAGTIALSPLRAFDPLGKTDDSDAWQLPKAAFPQLRRIVETAQSNRLALHDRVLQEWFHGPGGMIALDEVKLPADCPVTLFDAIEVRLESELGLHRSLGLVSGNVQPALSVDLLDAIMASIEQAATSEKQPIATTARLRIPSVVYPGAAVAATALVLSHQRRQSTKTSVSITPASSAISKS